MTNVEPVTPVDVPSDVASSQGDSTRRYSSAGSSSSSTCPAGLGNSSSAVDTSGENENVDSGVGLPDSVAERRNSSPSDEQYVDVEEGGEDVADDEQEVSGEKKDTGKRHFVLKLPQFGNKVRPLRRSQYCWFLFSHIYFLF